MAGKLRCACAVFLWFLALQAAGQKKALDKDGCKVKNKVYKLGQEFESRDGCSTCLCQMNAEVSCTRNPCPDLQCHEKLRVKPRKECCQKCKPGCYVEGRGVVRPGQKIKSADKCRKCACVELKNGTSAIQCSSPDCPPCGEGSVVKDDGTCCGVCESDKLTSAPDGLATGCEKVVCLALNCRKKLQVKNDSSCCPECHCMFRGETIKPGSFCEKGRICVCQDGKVQCSYPDCPLRSLDCVDYEMGGDCCFHCRNGATCLVPGDKQKTVIKHGEYKVVKNKVCACAGEPWYPYAFCAPRAINKSFLKTYGDMLVDYMEI